MIQMQDRVQIARGYTAFEDGEIIETGIEKQEVDGMIVSPHFALTRIPASEMDARGLKGRLFLLTYIPTGYCLPATNVQRGHRIGKD